MTTNINNLSSNVINALTQLGQMGFSVETRDRERNQYIATKGSIAIDLSFGDENMYFDLSNYTKEEYTQTLNSLNCLAETTTSNATSYTAMSLSTGHITLKDSQLLEQLAKNSNQIMSRNTGFFIKLCPEEMRNELKLYASQDLSHELCKIIEYAHSTGYSLIEFDEAAPISELFPLFEW